MGESRLSESCKIVEDIIRGINENQQLDDGSKLKVLNIILAAFHNEVGRLKEKHRREKSA